MKTAKFVQFRFFREALNVCSEKAQLVKLGNVNDPIKVWLPVSQISVVDDPEDEGYKLITMPEWLYLSRPALSEYTDPYYID